MQKMGQFALLAVFCCVLAGCGGGGANRSSREITVGIGWKDTTADLDLFVTRYDISLIDAASADICYYDNLHTSWGADHSGDNIESTAGGAPILLEGVDIPDSHRSDEPYVVFVHNNEDYTVPFTWITYYDGNSDYPELQGETSVDAHSTVRVAVMRSNGMSRLISVEPVSRQFPVKLRKPGAVRTDKFNPLASAISHIMVRKNVNK